MMITQTNASLAGMIILGLLLVLVIVAAYHWRWFRYTLGGLAVAGVLLAAAALFIARPMMGPSQVHYSRSDSGVHMEYSDEHGMTVKVTAPSGGGTYRSRDGQRVETPPAGATAVVTTAPAERQLAQQVSIDVPVLHGWQPSSELEFEADKYPSSTSAAEALAGRFRRQFQRALEIVAIARLGSNQDPELPKLHLVITGDVDNSLLAAVRGVLDSCFYSMEIDQRATSTQPATRPANDNQCIFEIGISADTGVRSPLEQVTCSARCALLNFSWSDQAWVSEKHWVEQPRRVSATWKGRHASWAVATTTDFEGSISEAMDQALKHAANEIIRRIDRSVLGQSAGQPMSDWGSRKYEAWFMNHIETALERGHRSLTRAWPAGTEPPTDDQYDPLIVDQFIQTFERPYGKVYRVALLVNMQPEVIDSLAKDYLQTGEQALAATRIKVVLLGAMAALIVLTYVVVNAMTKGYYTWRLRGGVIAAIAVVAVALIMLSIHA